jgi:glutamate synthase (ferredoxin)
VLCSSCPWSIVKLNFFDNTAHNSMVHSLVLISSTMLCSYHGAQIFEIYGLGRDVVDVGFRGSVSRIGGLTLDEV